MGRRGRRGRNRRGSKRNKRSKIPVRHFNVGGPVQRKSHRGRMRRSKRPECHGPVGAVGHGSSLDATVHRAGDGGDRRHMGGLRHLVVVHGSRGARLEFLVDPLQSLFGSLDAQQDTGRVLIT